MGLRERKMRNDWFLLTEHRLFIKDAKPEWIAQPFTSCPTRQSDDPNTGWGRLVTFETEDGERREVFVRADHLVVRPYKVVADLADLGLCVSQARGARRRVIEFLIDSGEPP